MSSKGLKIAVAVLAAAVVGVGAFAVVQTTRLADSRRVCAIYGEHAVNELASSLDALEVSLSASLEAEDGAALAESCAEAAVHARIALSALGALPCASYEFERMAGNLDAALDYTSWAVLRAAAGTLTPEDAADTLAQLHGRAETISSGTASLRQALADSAVCMSEFGECGDSDCTDTVGSELRGIEAALDVPPEIEYPA